MSQDLTLAPKTEMITFELAILPLAAELKGRGASNLLSVVVQQLNL
ncbi:hypothetical protein HC248_00250 [Polaromonas vacuolata]|uniref:Uncharacterized protein n=1 Tax=Polaromonas vacuolata TaxID=37448 RepID=A0A6H2H5E4_9BURK|nr:hypothetical protein [Polaromonas vacuolata]QJC54987.1 hypothetical protein HC248_00250 [Polaromonas vacuolata]